VGPVQDTAYSVSPPPDRSGLALWHHHSEFLFFGQHPVALSVRRRSPRNPCGTRCRSLPLWKITFRLFPVAITSCFFRGLRLSLDVYASFPGKRTVCITLAFFFSVSFSFLLQMRFPLRAFVILPRLVMRLAPIRETSSTPPIWSSSLLFLVRRADALSHRSIINSSSTLFVESRHACTLRCPPSLSLHASPCAPLSM